MYTEAPKIKVELVRNQRQTLPRFSTAHVYTTHFSKHNIWH